MNQLRMQRLADHPPAVDAAPPGPAGADPARRAGGRVGRHLPARLPEQRGGRLPDRVRRIDDLVEPIWEAASAQAATPSTDPIIVSVFLDGGNDGLNTLVPVTGADYAAYVTKRPNIGLHPPLPAAGRRGGRPRLALEPGRHRLPAALRRRQDGDHPGRRLHAARPLALPLAGLLAGRRARPRPRHRLAGPLDRPERRRRQPAAGDLGRLVAGRHAEDRGEPGGGAVERRRRPVLAEQRVVGRAADGGHAGGLAQRSAPRTARWRPPTARSAARSTSPTG